MRDAHQTRATNTRRSRGRASSCALRAENECNTMRSIHAPITIGCKPGKVSFSVHREDDQVTLGARELVVRAGHPWLRQHRVRTRTEPAVARTGTAAARAGEPHPRAAALTGCKRGLPACR